MYRRYIPCIIPRDCSERWKRIQIVFTIFRLIWNQTEVRLVSNQSDDGNYNLISGWFNKIFKRFFQSGPTHNFTENLPRSGHRPYLFRRVGRLTLNGIHYAESAHAASEMHYADGEKCTMQAASPMQLQTASPMHYAASEPLPSREISRKRIIWIGFSLWKGWGLGNITENEI